VSYITAYYYPIIFQTNAGNFTVAQVYEYESGRVKKVYDGDSFQLSDGSSVRLFGINTPEKGEPGSDEAKETLSGIIGNKDVYFETHKIDGYHRKVASVYIMRDGEMVDASELMVKIGKAHVFWFNNSKPQLLAKYLTLQNEARRRQYGIWDLPSFRRELHITSFHANGRGNDALDPNVEYFRLANISDRNINLGGYKVVDCESKKAYPLPAMDLPAGWTVSVRSGTGQNQTNIRRGELYIHLGSKTELWKDSGAKIIIVYGTGKVIDSKASNNSFVCAAP